MHAVSPPIWILLLVFLIRKVKFQQNKQSLLCGPIPFVYVTVTSFLSNFILFYVMSIFPECCVHTTCVCSMTSESRRGAGSPWNENYSCAPPCGCWEQNQICKKDKCFEPLTHFPSPSYPNPSKITSASIISS